MSPQYSTFSLWEWSLLNMFQSTGDLSFCRHSVYTVKRRTVDCLLCNVLSVCMARYWLPLPSWWKQIAIGYWFHDVIFYLNANFTLMLTKRLQLLVDFVLQPPCYQCYVPQPWRQIDAYGPTWIEQLRIVTANYDWPCLIAFDTDSQFLVNC